MSADRSDPVSLCEGTKLYLDALMIAYGNGLDCAMTVGSGELKSFAQEFTVLAMHDSLPELDLDPEQLHEFLLHVVAESVGRLVENKRQIRVSMN